MVRKIKNLTELAQTEHQRIFDGRATGESTVHFKIPDARNLLMRGLYHFLGERAVWQPEYEEVVEWLSDNKGKGLLLYGSCGRGKTLIAQKIIPVIFEYYLRKIIPCFTSRELNEKYSEISQYKLLSIDDVGQEDNVKVYGTTHKYFSELVDEAERHNKLLVLTTNLRKTIARDAAGNVIPDIPSLEARYDIRTVSRLRVLTKDICFQGDDLRGRE